MIINDKRALAYVVEINDIIPIKDADKIETAVIKGWKVVVKKDQFKPGDKAIYFEIDSFLPIKPEFEFLRSSSYRKLGELEGFRLKTIKLRKQISQGLIISFSDLNIEELFVNVRVIHKSLNEKSLISEKDGCKILTCNDEVYLVSVPDITNVVIPDGVTTVESYAFNQINKICILHIPNSVRVFEKNAFQMLKHLIYLENESDLSFGFYNNYGELEIVETQEDIIGQRDDYKILLICLKYGDYLTASNVDEIYQYAYTNVSGQYLVLYQDVDKINLKAFLGSNIKEIFFVGTEEEFKHYSNLDTYFFSDEEKEGNYWHFVGKRVVKWEEEKND